jgi:hypothetical protein
MAMVGGGLGGLGGRGMGMGMGPGMMQRGIGMQGNGYQDPNISAQTAEQQQFMQSQQYQQQQQLYYQQQQQMGYYSQAGGFGGRGLGFGGIPPAPMLVKKILKRVSHVHQSSFNYTNITHRMCSI